MKRCPRSFPLRRGLVLYSAIPRITPIAHRPHTQYRARYRTVSPGAGNSDAQANTVVTKSARKVDTRKSALFGRLRRLQASQPVKMPSPPRVSFASMRGMVAGVRPSARENSFGALQVDGGRILSCVVWSPLP